MKFWNREWSDGEKWIMGIVSALIITFSAWFASILWGLTLAGTGEEKPKSSTLSPKEAVTPSIDLLSPKKQSLPPAHYESFTEAEIRALVTSRVARVLKVPIQSIKPDMDLVNQPGVDSLHLVEMVIGVEDATRCMITDDVAEQLRTVEDIIKATVDSCNMAKHGG